MTQTTQTPETVTPRILRKVNFTILVREDGWIECSAEIAAAIMQVADSLVNQAIYNAQLLEAAKPKVILAS